MSVKPLKVSEVNKYIKRLFTGDAILSNVVIEGEVSNFKHHYSGHMYFSLKDEKSKIKCVMFKSYNRNINVTLKDGMNVIVEGYVSIYDRDGIYQLYVTDVKESGVGELFVAYNKLLKKLENEGLFDENKKKDIPKLPMKIGIVTSSTGAAIKDIITVIKRRFPVADLILYPVLVQGEGAAKNICEGLRYFDIKGNVDLVIVGRGGGSIEELFAFNDEILARTIYNMETPIISAVGHETDFTISDFVADLRAPTPSAAAELAVPQLNDLLDDLNRKMNRLTRVQLFHINKMVNELNYYGERLNKNNPLTILNDNRQDLDNLFKKLVNTYNSRVSEMRNKTEVLANALNLLSPLSTTNRGYGILTDESKQLIKSVEKIQVGDTINIIVEDGLIRSEVKELYKGEFENGYK